VGGDTMWANLYLAYETLSPSIRALLDDLEAVHDVSMIRGIEQRDPALVADMKRRNPPVIHPVVRTHPETGRKSLLVGQRIRGFLGMSDEEGQGLWRCSTPTRRRRSSFTGTAGASATS
jgi:taurine dioxygenase